MSRTGSEGLLSPKRQFRGDQRVVSTPGRGCAVPPPSGPAPPAGGDAAPAAAPGRAPFPAGSAAAGSGSGSPAAEDRTRRFLHGELLTHEAVAKCGTALSKRNGRAKSSRSDRCSSVLAGETLSG